MSRLEKLKEILPEDKEKFKDPKGAYLTQALFYEYRFVKRAGDYPMLYTLNDYDLDGCVSLKQVYLELRDPTEYTIATMCFYGWEHWQRLCAQEWFKKELDKWREELDTLIRADAFRTIAAATQKTDATGVAAAKYIAERGWEKNKPAKRGAPTKAEKKGHLKEMSRYSKELEEDLKRLNIVDDAEQNRPN